MSATSSIRVSLAVYCISFYLLTTLVANLAADESSIRRKEIDTLINQNHCVLGEPDPLLDKIKSRRLEYQPIIKEMLSEALAGKDWERANNLATLLGTLAEAPLDYEYLVDVCLHLDQLIMTANDKVDIRRMRTFNDNRYHFFGERHYCSERLWNHIIPELPMMNELSDRPIVLIDLARACKGNQAVLGKLKNLVAKHSALADDPCMAQTIRDIETKGR